MTLQYLYIYIYLFYQVIFRTSATVKIVYSTFIQLCSTIFYYTYVKSYNEILNFSIVSDSFPFHDLKFYKEILNVPYSNILFI